MSLTPASVNPQPFKTPFTLTISVGASSTVVNPDTGLPETVNVPVTDVPTVVASFEDPGVTVTTSPGTVTLSGQYDAIIPTTWYWKDLNDQLKSGPSAPLVGTYEKIVQVDSPPNLTETCYYTITSSAGVDIFEHIVTLVSYDVIKEALNTALAGQPTPSMP